MLLWAIKLLREEPFSIRILAEAAGVEKSKAQRAWKRRDELTTVGVISRRQWSGRPVAKSFRTVGQKRKSIELLENLVMGDHQRDGAKKLKCSVSTVYRHTHKTVFWRFPPDVDFRGDCKRVRELRYEYAFKSLTPKGKLKKILQNATFLDHKQVHAFGLNKSHQRQCRIKGSQKPVRPVPKANFNPKIHCFFSCSKFENNLFIHAKEVNFVRKKGAHLIHEKVNGKTLAYAIITKIGPAMKKVGSNLAIMDCVQVNHKNDVIEAFKQFGIRVYPSGGFPHNVMGGYPPYSHDCSPLDGWLFRPFQSEISTFCSIIPGSQAEAERGMMLELVDHIKKLWCSEKYERLSRDAVSKMARTLNDIVLRKGAQHYKN